VVDHGATVLGGAIPPWELPPWNIRLGGDVFALDLLRSIPASRLLERIDRASSADLERARRALRLIT
jgi:hypothetical protein